MGCGKSKLSNVDINTLKPFLQGKYLKCKIIEVVNFYTYKVLFYYNKQYLLWNCRFSEYYKDLIENTDLRKCNLIKKNEELFMFVHGLKENVLVIDFYKRKKDKNTLNSKIVDQMHKNFFSNMYKKSFKNNIITKPKSIENSVEQTKLLINTESKNDNVPNIKINIKPKNNEIYGTHKIKKQSLLDELKSKQKRID